MTDEDAKHFTERWIAAWNARDVEAVLVHFAEEVTFSSPLAARLIDGSGGTIRGKQALREYWLRGLEAHPDLRFELIGTYVGIDTLAINYRNQAGGIVTEVLRFDGPLVVEGHATHLSDASGED